MAEPLGAWPPRVAGELHELNSDSRPDIAIVQCEEREALWWSFVLADALEREHEYGLDETDDDVTCGSNYDEAKVAAWLREHVEPPRWRWHRWRPASEEEQDFWEVAAWLETSNAPERPGADWWRGAIVTVRQAAV